MNHDANNARAFMIMSIIEEKNSAIKNRIKNLV